MSDIICAALIIRTLRE